MDDIFELKHLYTLVLCNKMVSCDIGRYLATSDNHCNMELSGVHTSKAYSYYLWLCFIVIADRTNPVNSILGAVISFTGLP